MPNQTMHRLLAKLVALIIAVNGVACACPAAIVDNDETTHHAHSAHGEMTMQEVVKDDPRDCCENCDGADAKKRNSDAGLFADVRKSSEDSRLAAIESNELRMRWRTTRSVRLPPGLILDHLQTNSPVALRDRMLD